MSPRLRLPVRAQEADGGTARPRDGGNATPEQPIPLAARPASAESPDSHGRPVPPSRPLALSPSPSRPAVDGAVAQYWRALRDVSDPEFPISIVDLGLVYDVRASGGLLEIDLTFTATGCPCMDFIREDVSDRLLREPGVTAVRIREVWDPPWTPGRISPEGRAVLRAHGVGS